MKELYVEVLAKHDGHESCADDQEIVREAFDSGIYRLGIEPRKGNLECRRCSGKWKATSETSLCEMLMNSTWSKALHMYRNFMHGNREILQLALSTCVLKVRVENPNGVQQ